MMNSGGASAGHLARTFGSFSGLNDALGGLQRAMMQREGDPADIAAQAESAVRTNIGLLDKGVPNDAVAEFAARCGTLLRNSLPPPETAKLAALMSSHIESDGSTVASCASLIAASVELAGRASSKESVGILEPVVAQAYHRAIYHWGRATQPVMRGPAMEITTRSMISLLRGASVVYVPDFRFTSAVQGSRGLLPLRSKIQMEAKMQRSGESRSILNFLRELSFSRIDAGMCLNLMAKTGLYDAEVANRCCETLYSNRMMLSSRQLTQVINNLGMMGHRSTYASGFIGAVRMDEVSAADVRQHVVGMAMLQYRFSGDGSEGDEEQEKVLLDGVWMHALRHRRSQAASRERNGRNDAAIPPPPECEHAPPGPPVMAAALGVRSAGNGHALATPATASPLVPNSEKIDWEWHVDVNHALSLLYLTPHKLLLHSSRELRPEICHFDATATMKALYAFGGHQLQNVPVPLRENWEKKVDKFVSVLVSLSESKARGIHASQLPTMVLALRHCGVVQHALFPKALNEEEANQHALRELLGTWAIASTDRTLALLRRCNRKEYFSIAPGMMCALFRVIQGACEGGALQSVPAATVAREMRGALEACSPFVPQLSGLELRDSIQFLSSAALLSHVPEFAAAIGTALLSKRKELHPDAVLRSAQLLEETKVPQCIEAARLLRCAPADNATVL